MSRRPRSDFGSDARSDVHTMQQPSRPISANVFANRDVLDFKEGLLSTPFGKPFPSDATGVSNPYANPYASSFGAPFGSSFNTPTNTAYNAPFNAGYNAAYNAPLADPYAAYTSTLNGLNLAGPTDPLGAPFDLPMLTGLNEFASRPSTGNKNDPVLESVYKDIANAQLRSNLFGSAYTNYNLSEPMEPERAKRSHTRRSNKGGPKVNMDKSIDKYVENCLSNREKNGVTPKMGAIELKMDTRRRPRTAPSSSESKPITSKMPSSNKPKSDIKPIASKMHSSNKPKSDTKPISAKMSSVTELRCGDGGGGGGKKGKHRGGK
jgi:hypothetical protein